MNETYQQLAELTRGTSNRVVRIHCLGAIKALGSNQV